MAEQTKIVPPIAKKVLKETQAHGITLKDEYFWLREKENTEVLDYLKAENAYTDQETSHLKAVEEKLFEEMKGRIKEDDETVPYVQKDYLYNSEDIKGKQYKIHKRVPVGGDPKKDTEIIFDENKMAEGQEYFDLMDFQISPNQKFAAFATDDTGYEKFVLQIKNLETGEILSDRVENIGWSFEWADDNTIYYNIRDSTQRCHALMRHTVGQAFEKDELIFQEDDDKREVSVWKSSDGKYLYHSASSSTSDETYFLNLEQNEKTFSLFLAREDKHEYSISHQNGYFYIVTNQDEATNFKLMRCKSDNTDRKAWEEIIPHNIEVRLTSTTTFKDFMIVKSRYQGLINYEVFFGKGDPRNHKIETPENIYSIWASYNEVYEADFFRFNYSSLKTPRTTFDYFVNTKKLEQRKQAEIFNYNPDEFFSERKFVTVRDGTQVPISIVYKKGTQFPAPTLLYGYGSYGVCIDTMFDSKRISLLDQNVVFIIAHIRGGGEMGKKWQDDGKFLKKMNTFYDFIDCAKYIHEQKITTPELTTIRGASAGGLLMGAVTNLAPEISKLCIAEVPFIDVINTMMDASIPLTTGEYEEWGNPADKEYFDYMLSYSPYDQIKAQKYPNMLITGGLNDPRVQYWEPAKWVAKLRAMRTNDANSEKVMLKMKMGSGHMGASGRYEYMKEHAFVYAYLFDTFGITVKN